LIIPYDESRSGLPPAAVFLYRRGESGELLSIPDGEYWNVISSENNYKMNVTRFVQRYLNGDYDSNELVIKAGANGVTANRVRLHGPEFNLMNHFDNMRLIVTFTE
jgi:hypothetical protein